jgi:glycosyltransferase involved in cell wall biosynthesis
MNKVDSVVFAPYFLKDQLSIYKNIFVIYIHIPDQVIIKRLYEQFILPWVVLTKSVNYLLSVNNASPLLLLNKNILVMHDTARWDIKGSGNFLKVQFLKIIAYFSMLLSKKIITVSEYSRSRIVSMPLISAKKVFVVYNGINFDMFKVISHEEVNEACKKYKLIPKRYLFMHSTFESRKNHINLIEAYVKSGIKDNLVFAGKPGFGYEKVVKLIS